jgi:hypothetical protein
MIVLFQSTASWICPQVANDSPVVIRPVSGPPIESLPGFESLCLTSLLVVAPSLRTDASSMDTIQAHPTCPFANRLAAYCSNTLSGCCPVQLRTLSPSAVLLSFQSHSLAAFAYYVLTNAPIMTPSQGHVLAEINLKHDPILAVQYWLTSFSKQGPCCTY